MSRTVGIETCFITPRLCYKNVANLKKALSKFHCLCFCLFAVLYTTVDQYLQLSAC